jgi:putative N6-adenine-specific DNA methylase
MRNEFGFERWKDWDVDLYETIEQSLLKKTRDFHHKMIGYDKSPSAVRKAIENIKNAHLEEFIEVKHEDFFKTQKGGQKPLHLLFNPPYGLLPLTLKRLNMLDFELPEKSKCSTPN